MNHTAKLAFLAVSIITLYGCTTAKTYVDPQYHKAIYESIKRLAQPIPVKVDAHFQRNGQPVPRLDNGLRLRVEKILRSSGVLVPATADTQTIITITGNNVYDLREPFVKSLKPKMFDRTGFMVEDNYEFVCVYQVAGVEKRYKYNHALFTPVHGAKVPPGLTPMTVDDAFGIVVMDVILNFIKDLQDSGLASQQGTDVPLKLQPPVTEKKKVPASPLPPPSTDFVVVTWTSANIRSGAGNEFPVVTTVKRGDRLTLIGEDREWFNVRLEDGKEGWINSRVVK